MWCKSHGDGETLMDTYLMPLSGTNGDGEMLLYLFRSVDAAGEVKRVLGELSGLHPATLFGKVLDGVVERAGVDPGAIEQVIGGCVTQAGEQAGNVARHAWLSGPGGVW